jgi:ankyrin repeat protein
MEFHFQPSVCFQLGTSALHIAAKNNFYDTCATLLRSGISKDAKTKVDRTPLHFAVFEGNFEICQLLIQHECSVDPVGYGERASLDTCNWL